VREDERELRERDTYIHTYIPVAAHVRALTQSHGEAHKYYQVAMYVCMYEIRVRVCEVRV